MKSQEILSLPGKRNKKAGGGDGDGDGGVVCPN